MGAKGKQGFQLLSNYSYLKVLQAQRATFKGVCLAWNGTKHTYVCFQFDKVESQKIITALFLFANHKHLYIHKVQIH